MFSHTGCGAGMNIADEADFQRDSLIENVLGKVAQFHRFAFRDSDVIDQPSAMPNAMRAAVLNGLPDGFLSVRPRLPAGESISSWCEKPAQSEFRNTPHHLCSGPQPVHRRRARVLLRSA